MTPPVSIVQSVRGGEVDAARSLRALDYPDAEILLIDEGCRNEARSTAVFSDSRKPVGDCG